MLLLPQLQLELVERVQLRDERQQFGGSSPPGVPNAMLSPQSEILRQRENTVWTTALVSRQERRGGGGRGAYVLRNNSEGSTDNYEPTRSKIAQLPNSNLEGITA